MPVRSARATWKGGLKTGSGSFKTESGLTATYNYSSRFGEERASNPFLNGTARLVRDPPT